MTPTLPPTYTTTPVRPEAAVLDALRRAAGQRTHIAPTLDGPHRAHPVHVNCPTALGLLALGVLIGLLLVALRGGAL